ncbi:MAG: hypothetical protein HY216_10310 [Candidatus Rokubacteria bacterium]|nr:hypothetical protein [Candidatus Rokubacteria bacterium]
MRRLLLIAACASIVSAGVSSAAEEAAMGTKLSGSEIRPRVDYHVRQAEELGSHFDRVILQDCPRFVSSEDWDTWIDGETDQLVSLVAHLEQAWEEAKRTGDDDVRRVAKAPRRRLGEARWLLEKLTTCADHNNALLQPSDIIDRVQRDVPRRQVEIALPQ